jgi:hypothetical protein
MSRDRKESAASLNDGGISYFLFKNVSKVKRKEKKRKEKRSTFRNCTGVVRVY